jgi:hypothetical protein
MQILVEIYGHEEKPLGPNSEQLISPRVPVSSKKSFAWS